MPAGSTVPLTTNSKGRFITISSFICAFCRHTAPTKKENVARIPAYFFILSHFDVLRLVIDDSISRAFTLHDSRSANGSALILTIVALHLSEACSTTFILAFPSVTPTTSDCLRVMASHRQLLTSNGRTRLRNPHVRPANNAQEVQPNQ